MACERFLHRHQPATLAEQIDALMIAVFVEDDADRMTRLVQPLAPEFVFVSPGEVAEGAQGLSDAFGTFRHDRWRETSLRRTGDVDLHHGNFRFTWARREGQEADAEGWGIGQLNTDGRISRIVTFNGLTPGPVANDREQER